MSRNFAVHVVACLAMLAAASGVYAQQTKTYRIGIIREGGPDIAAVQGLKEGLEQLGLHEGTNYVLENRDLMGDRSSIRTTAQQLERLQVDVIYSIATSVTIAVNRATTKVPIVFAVGSDPVSAGLIDTFAKPGGRLTGVHYLTTDTTAKRLQILRSIKPDLHKVLTFYDPHSDVAVRALHSMRDAATQLKIDVVAKPVASVQELRNELAAFTNHDADAFFYVNDAMVRSQAQLIADTMREKKVPTMFSFPSIASQGALAGYGVSLREVGRLSARYVQKVLTGNNPAILSVESVSGLELVLNARTAREIGVAIPESVLLTANDVVQ